MIRILVALICVFLVGVPILAAGPVFPGPRPGIAQAKVEGTQLILENDLLSVRWDLADGLHLIEAKDKSNSQSWSTGRSECLKIVYYESPSPRARTVTGSQMKMVRPPTITDAPVSYAMKRRSDQYPGKQILVHLVTQDKTLSVTWRASLRDEENYVRQTVELQTGDEWVELNKITLIDVSAKEAAVQGSVDGSPATAGQWFMGLEHPMSHSEVVTSENDKTHRVQCSYLFAPSLEPWKSQSYSAVLGLAPRDQLRRGFLYYLERERAHPYRPFLLQSPGEDMAAIYSDLRGKRDEV